MNAAVEEYEYEGCSKQIFFDRNDNGADSSIDLMGLLHMRGLVIIKSLKTGSSFIAS